ncbi:hypothetical protein ACSV4D_09480 [Flavobacterium sp. ARAG 55.4]|uniref:hypothetical protein n=1 Tax=Flavobacterium sp. ARAG 55.4 TaxID=3451357 RepID=UPI003F48C1EA
MKRINIRLKFLLICVLVFVCCFLTSCRSVRQETQKSTSTTETIIQQKESYRDTVLFTPKAETSLKIPVNELAFKEGLNSISRPKVFTQKNGNATAKVEITPTDLTVTAICDSLAIAAKIKQELRSQISATARSDVGNQTTKSGYNLLDIIVAFLTGLSIGLSLMYIITFIRKIFS